MSVNKHNATVGKKLVDIIKMRPFMQTFPVQVMNCHDPLLLWQVEPHHHYWDASDGTSLGPNDLMGIENWDTAEIDYPNWSEHIKKVKNADLSFPIWLCVMPDQHEPTKELQVIFDGMHRYTKALITGQETISVIKIHYEKIPANCVID